MAPLCWGASIELVVAKTHLQHQRRVRKKKLREQYDIVKELTNDQAARPKEQTAKRTPLPGFLHRPAWIFLSLMPFCMPLAVMAHSLGYVWPSLAHRGSLSGGHDSGRPKRSGRRVRASTRHIVFRLFSLSLQGSVETRTSMNMYSSAAQYVVQLYVWII